MRNVEFIIKTAAGSANDGETPAGSLGLHWRRPVWKDEAGKLFWQAADGPSDTSHANPSRKPHANPSRRPRANNGPTADEDNWESVQIDTKHRVAEIAELKGMRFARVVDIEKKDGTLASRLEDVELHEGPLFGVASSAAELEEEMRENALLALIANAEEVEEQHPVRRMGGGGLGKAFTKWRAP